MLRIGASDRRCVARPAKGASGVSATDEQENGVSPMYVFLAATVGGKKFKKMLSLAYELHGHAVYTGVCYAHGQWIEDDWVLFEWSERSLLLHAVTSIVLSATSGWMVPVHVAHRILVSKPDGTGECVSCARDITTSWEYCESCLSSLCDSCIATGTCHACK